MKWWTTGHSEAEAHIDLAQLVADHSTLLFRVAHSVVRNAAEAEDIVQDTFVRVLQKRNQLPEVREMRLWLVRIAWNLAIDRKRRICPEQMDELFANSIAGRHPRADDACSNTQQLRHVLQEMDRLPKAERDALLLSAVEEMSTADIAEVLGKSESAVRALLFRARTRLKERCGMHSVSRKGDPR